MGGKSKLSFDSPQRSEIFEQLEWGRMIPGDLLGGLRLSECAGWSQREDDWQLIYRLNPQGAFVVRHFGKVVATVSALKYGSDVGWIGMMLVDSAYRGMGIARRLMETACAALADQYSIQLDATPAGQAVYSKLGFKESFGLKRMVIRDSHSFPAIDREVEWDRHIRPMVDSDLEYISGWDRGIIGADRGELLNGLFRMTPEYARVFIQGGEISGFVFGRHGAQFEHIGPLVAKDFAAAKALCGDLLLGMNGKAVAMDIPDAHSEWVSYVSGLGMTVERPFVRMYLGELVAHIPNNCVHAIAGPEFS